MANFFGMKNVVIIFALAGIILAGCKGKKTQVAE